MRVKRLLSLGMSVIMLTSMLSGTGVKAQQKTTEETEQQTNQLLVHYDMTSQEGKLLDVTGNGYDATCVGVTDENFVTENGETSLTFTGSKDEYVKLPDGILQGENFTIESTFQTSVAGDQWLYCFGTKEGKWPNVKDYIFCNPNQKGGTVRIGLKDETAEQLCQTGSIDTSAYNKITTVFEDGVMTVYVNDVKTGSVEHGYTIQDILTNGVEDKTDCIGYLGKSLFTLDPAFTGSISDFKIYNYAKSENDIVDQDKRSDEEIVADAKEELSIPDSDNIRGNITLVSTFGEANLTWESSNEEVISVTEKENKDYDPTPAGVVTRQEKDTVVTLKAKISSGNVTDTKEFAVTVKAKAKELTSEDYGGYLFVHFTGESETGEQIYFSLSKDGLHWNDLNDGEPILISGLGEKGVRDPFVLRSPEGDKFYLIATDLRIASGKGWSVAQYSGSRALIIWESDDLVNWSEPRRVEVGIPSAGCVWAPEAIYDNKTGDYMVFWASMVKEEGDSAAKQRIYCSKTRDFVTFTEAEKYIEKDNHVIDTTILQSNGQYYRYSKDETTKRIGIDTSSQLLHSEFTTVNSDTLSSLSGVEGPLIFKFNDRDEWCLMVDQYGSGKGYLPLVTDDLASGDFKILSTDDYSLGSNLKRHGTVLNLTNTEYEALSKKWGSSDVTLDEEEQQDPVLSYDFEDSSDQTVMKDTSGNGRDGSLSGNAAIVKDDEINSNVLSLDGTTGTFAAFPQGFFDGRNTVTISMDIKAQTVSGNFFTFAIGKDTNKYMFLRTRDMQIRNAITKGSYGAEQEVVFTTESIKNKWMNLKLVLTPTSMEIYKDGDLMSKNEDITVKMSDLGKNLLAYLGKSFYSPDAYFAGSFDNVKVYNRALSATEIASEYGKEVNTIAEVQAEGYHVMKNAINKEDHTIELFVSRANSTKKTLGTANVTFTFENGASLDGENGQAFDLSKENKFTVKKEDGSKEEWSLKATLCYNNILAGQFADPDIDVFGDTYYIYPTTDGFDGWSGTVFHAFSSKDLVDWKDEGIIVDVASDQVKWAVGSAWAPTIEEKDGKYYFYFCAKREDGNSCIGVAVANNPAGPFTAAEEPLLTPEIASAAGISMGQTIDPSVFTDDDGTSYLTFGNGKAAIVELNQDMTSIKTETMKNITGLTDFRESVVIVKRDGKYHFTWSCDDTGSENYHVNYGVADSLDGQVTYMYTLLAKDGANDILGTGHQSILKIPGKDEYYLAYHRFGTPLSSYTSGKGYHRETCLDKITFDENGYMKVVTPTLTGITEKVTIEQEITKPTEEPTATPEPTPTITPTETPGVTETPAPERTEVTVPKVEGVSVKVESTSSITVNWKKATGAAGYNVAYKINGTWSYETVTGTTYTLRKLSAGTEVKVNVQAYKVVDGKSYMGAYSSKVVTATKPATVSAKASDNKTTSVKISWKTAKGASGYEVQEKVSGKWKTIQSVSAKTTSVKVKKLSAATIYEFRVRAFKTVDGKKIYGDYSKKIKTATQPKAPAITKLKAKSKQVTVSWKKVSGATGYQVYQYNAKKKSYIKVKTITKAGTTSYVSARQANGTTVKYKVRAYKTVDGTKIYSDYSSAKSIKVK